MENHQGKNSEGTAAESTDQPAADQKPMFGRTAKLLVTFGVLLGSVSIIASKSLEIQRLWPAISTNIWYGVAAESCLDPTGFATSLRSANLPMIRCYIEGKGRSASSPLDADSAHGGHYPLALVAEACNVKAAEYLVLRGADARYGHIYFDPNRPPGPSNDTPRAIAFSQCRNLPGNPELTPAGKTVVKFLTEEEERVAPGGR